MTGAARWKRQEREIASVLGTHRLPNIGIGQPDCRAGGVAYQVKTRASIPAWLTAAMAQATRDADPGEVPAVVVSEVQPGRKARRVVCLDFDDFTALVAGGGPAQTDTETGAGRAPPAPPAATTATQQPRTTARTLGAVHPSGDRPET